MRTQLGVIQSLPLAARAQHVENGIGTVAIRHPWASSSKAMRFHVHRQQWLQLRPQLIRNAKSRRGAIIRGSLSFSFLGLLLAHTAYFTTFLGYSDRLLVPKRVGGEKARELTEALLPISTRIAHQIGLLDD